MNPGKEEEKVSDPLVVVINELCTLCHENSAAKGFWKEYGQILEALNGIGDEKTREQLLSSYRKSWFAQRLALINSEVSEALEGDRKDLMDDKLTHRKMADVELADAMIRIFDLAGAMGIPLGEIIKEKMGFNTTRPYMHGKAY